MQGALPTGALTFDSSHVQYTIIYVILFVLLRMHPPTWVNQHWTFSTCGAFVQDAQVNHTVANWCLSRGSGPSFPCWGSSILPYGANQHRTPSTCGAPSEMCRGTTPWPIGVSHGVSVHPSPTGAHLSVPTGQINIGHPPLEGLPSKLCRGTTPWPIGVSLTGLRSTPDAEESDELLTRRSRLRGSHRWVFTLAATPHDAPAFDASHMWVFCS